MKFEEIFKRLDADMGAFILNIRQMQNPKRVIIDISPNDLLSVGHYFLDVLGMRLITATATQLHNQFEILYHFSHDREGLIFNIRVLLPENNPVIESLANITDAANWIEREMHELYGINFLHHPEQTPLLSEGNWGEDDFPFRNKS
jgi:NADH-quinone oxidoreductase subunit C